MIPEEDIYYILKTIIEDLEDQTNLMNAILLQIPDEDDLDKNLRSALSRAINSAGLADEAIRGAGREARKAAILRSSRELEQIS